MKKAKAIELLKLAVPIKALTQQEYSDFVEAVNMGMDALEQPTSPDTIDRKAALDALARTAREKFNLSDEFNHYLAGLMDGELAIKELPTIQPEPKKGHWIPHESIDGGIQYECSECGVLWEFNDGSPEDNEAYFCPKCGTRMKGERT